MVNIVNMVNMVNIPKNPEKFNLAMKRPPMGRKIESSELAAPIFRGGSEKNNEKNIRIDF